MKRVRHRRVRKQSILIKSMAAGIAVALNRVAVSATDNWTNTSGGNWETATNWSLNAVPTIGTAAFFNTGSGTPYTVTLPGTEIAQTVNVLKDSVTFDSTNNTLESLDAVFGWNVTAASGQSTSLTVLGNGGYGMEVDNFGLNVGATGTGTASFTDNGVRLTCDGGNYNFAAGSVVSINALIRGDAGAGLIVRGTATIGSSMLQSVVTVGGPGPLGATLNGSVFTSVGPINIGSGGIGTVNAALSASGVGPINIGVDSPGTLNANGVSSGGEAFNIGTSGVAGVLNITNGGSAVANLTTTIGANGIVNVIGGTLQTHAVAVLSGGQLNGSGGSVGPFTIDPTASFTNNGTVTVLNTAASSKLTVGSIYNQSIGGVLAIPLATETTPGSGVFYTGAELATMALANLNGTLDVTAPADFPITNGELFQVLSLSSEAGSFSSIILPPLSSGLSWNTQSLYSNGSISVVPEPTTAGMLGIAAILLRRSKRKH